MFHKLSVATALVVAFACFSAVNPSKADAESPGCQSFASLSGVATFSGFLSMNNWRMDDGAFNAGDRVTITVTWVSTPFPAEFDIATLFIPTPHPFAAAVAGPISIPGTLTYVYVPPLPGSEPRMGLGFDLGTNDLLSVGTVNVSASCTPASNPSGNAPGTSIPSGFVLRSISCTVAVFDNPGGNPVGSNVITSGQTWFVSPKPVADKHGKLWTEVFVGGVSDGFVPASCVQSD